MTYLPIDQVLVDLAVRYLQDALSNGARVGVGGLKKKSLYYR